MSLRVDLPDELAERVTLAASERGVPADLIVAEAGLTHRIDEMLADGFGQD